MTFTIKFQKKEIASLINLLEKDIKEAQMIKDSSFVTLQDDHFSSYGDTKHRKVIDKQNRIIKNNENILKKLREAIN